MSSEIWDLYDRNGKRTGETFERYFGGFRDIPEGSYHLVVDLLVLHGDGTYLLTKRSDIKDVYPGYWEASAGGSAVSGEEPEEAARRELFEETGLTPDSLELVSIVFKDSSHGMYYSYLARVSGDKTVTLQEGETTDYKWVDREGFLEYVDAKDSMTAHNQRYEKYINAIRSGRVPVRMACTGDIPAIMELLKQVNKVHHDGRPDLFKLNTKYTEGELEGIIRNDRTPVFVYEGEDGRILGHGFCVLQRPENTRLLTDILTLYIDDICVDENSRGQHVGSEIYGHILEFARRCGCHNVTLNVWNCNPGAMAFYKKLGLVPYKVGMEKIL